MDKKRKIQILGILLFAFTLMYGISLIGHADLDDMQITSEEAVYGNPFNLAYSNPGGMMGAYFSYITLFFLGWPAFFIIPFAAILALKIIGFDFARRLFKHTAIAWALAFMLAMVLDISRVANGQLKAFSVPDGVGALGHTVLEIGNRLVGITGMYIFTLAVLVSTLVYYAAISHRFRNAMRGIWKVVENWLGDGLDRSLPMLEDMWGKTKVFLGFKNKAVLHTPAFDKELKKARRNQTKANTPENIPDIEEEPPGENIIVDTNGSMPQKTTSPAKRKVVLSRKREATSSGDTEGAADFVMPGLDLLIDLDQTAPAYDQKELTETAQTLRQTLETFGVRISGNIEMFPGPVITRFEIKPAAGVKVNQINNLADDLALNLRAKSIRIVAPIPGKAAVGIEIPNRNPQVVSLKEVLASDEFQNNNFHLPIVLGKDIGGKPFVTDLSSMPHLLIAGTTGSGKSVSINVIITSLMYSLTPDNLRFIFIDPKMLELTIYKDIPYLDEKVVTNPKSAERVLGDAVTEMERRYRTLAGASVRNIVDFNKKQKDAAEKLPYIVIIIDELADLMMSMHSSKVELLITRLAQMARAVGIHLILATQRPSVDVITGLIKANFPSRIAFQVATKIDSRTILDGNGAERLLGKGDMLYLETGSPAPDRLHGAYVSSDETEQLVAFVRDQSYSQAKVEETKVVAEEKAQMRQFSDPVIVEAIETVVRQGQASVSLLQRKLGIGYQRAARIIDDLEEMKIIGEYNESKARDVLVDKSFIDGIRNGKIGKT